MIEAHLSEEAAAVGLRAPALALVRRVAVKPGSRGSPDAALAGSLTAPEALTRLAAGSPVVAAAGAAPEGWQPWGPPEPCHQTGAGRIEVGLDGRPESHAGSHAGSHPDNLRQACLAAAVEAGLPMLVHDAESLLENLHVGALGGPTGLRQVDLHCGTKWLSCIGSAGVEIAPTVSVRPETTHLLLFVPGRADVTAADTRAVCIRAVRLMRSTCPEVYAQIIPLRLPAHPA